MVSKILTIKSKDGLHARPAALLSKKAAEYNSDISMECGGKKANMKKLMEVLCLGVDKGDSIKLIVSGSDESLALDEILKYMDTI